MFPRRSLSLPIALGVVMIVLVVLLIVGWVVMSVFGMFADAGRFAFYVTFLSLGATFLALVLGGVVTYLTLTIKAINLNRRQSNFIDSVTHELKSPIASLKLYLQTLRRRQLPPEETGKFYHDMLEDVERLDKLINHLLDVARLDYTPNERDLEDILLADLLPGVIEGVCLRYQTPTDVVRINAQPCLVRGRRVDMELILRNLIDNAVKYASKENPLIDVTIEPGRTQVVYLRVADNGGGIKSKDRSKIFGRFERLGSELERETTGMGLGLYIVGQLVSRLRGVIRVRDSSSGGALFEVQFPAAPAKPAAK